MFCKKGIPGTPWCGSWLVPRFLCTDFGWGFFCLCSHVFNTCSVSVANNFVRPQPSADYEYYAFGEVSHFVYCLLQKIKQSSVMPLVENKEEYMTPNHSKFAAIEEDRFLAGTRVLSALEKVGSSYLK